MRPSAVPLDESPTLRLREVLAGLSYALDLTEGLRPGHSVRTTLIGMRLADRLGLPPQVRESLFHALLLKDLGCSSNSARFAAIFGHDDHELKATLATINWSNALQSFRFVATSTLPGASWHSRVWRVLSVLARGPEGAREVVRTRCERGAEIARLLGLSEDNAAEAFARVIDAKSPWTYRHSNGVADLAVAMARRFDFAPAQVRRLRLGALLHDLGKLGVSNLILDKPGRLDDRELAVMRQHPAHTASILQRVSCFAPLAPFAAAHHERLDGRGYHRGVAGADLGLDARILCVADIADALRASRPYRAGLPIDTVLGIMGRDVGSALDAECVRVLSEVLYAGAVAPAATPPAAVVVPALAEDYAQAA